MKFVDPKTGNTRLLGGSDAKRQARALEEAGWKQIDGEEPSEVEVLRARVEELEAALAEAERKLKRRRRSKDESIQHE